MKAAPRSSRVVMKWIDDEAIASITCRFSSPGRPKTYSTPSFSRHETRSCATLRCWSLLTAPAYGCGGADDLGRGPMLGCRFVTDRPEHLAISWAQQWEDVRLWRVPPHPTPGFYVGVGAKDPVFHSATQGCYDHGSSGLLIEPPPAPPPASPTPPARAPGQEP